MLCFQHPRMNKNCASCFLCLWSFVQLLLGIEISLNLLEYGKCLIMKPNFLVMEQNWSCNSVIIAWARPVKSVRECVKGRNMGSIPCDMEWDGMFLEAALFFVTAGRILVMNCPSVFPDIYVFLYKCVCFFLLINFYLLCILSADQYLTSQNMH